MKIKFYIATLLALATSMGTRAQKVMDYGSPVGFPITLAGNFGEIRSNHFHSGIDIKALQGVGSPIYAVEEGYISRISVSPTGYGNMLMVTHPDGTHSLYGHLDGFVEPYSKYIEQEQLRAKRFKVDRYISKGKFPVNKGDVIGYMGNTGSSGGPHLHLEFRDAASNAINPLTIGGYHVSDHISPSLFKVHIYQRDTIIMGVPIFAQAQTLEMELKNGTYTPKGAVPKISKPFYLAYEVIDYKDGRSNTMGITKMEQRVNGTQNFGFEIDKISFSTTRYINTFVQYDQNSTARFHVLRAYVSSNNLLGFYSGVRQRGLIAPMPTGETLNIRTSITDDNNNTSEIALDVLCQEPSKKPLILSETEKVAFSHMPFAYS
ncbi:MAG: M23 family metallopeptidase, partial [Rikenellaceae bacterium]